MLSTDLSYDNRTIASTLKMQIWIATNNRDVPRGDESQSFRLRLLVFSVFSSEGHIMPPHIFDSRLESQHQSVPGCAEECGVVMVKAMDCGIVVCEFKLQSRYYVHFRENTLGKGMNPLILPVMG